MPVQVAAHDIGALHPDYKPPRRHLKAVTPGVGPSHPRGTVQRRGELVVMQEAIEELRRRQARQSFPAFLEYCFKDESTGEPIEVQWFQEEWSEAMDCEKRLLILSPRNSGKSTIIVARTIWELGRNPNLRIKVVCASDSKAKERLFEIKTHIEADRVREVFPHLQEDRDAEWSRHKLYVARKAKHRDASIEALGITSTATGGRADLLIADDVVDRRNAISFPALRETIKQAWKADWTNLLEPTSRIWGIATLWHRSDLNHELMVNPAYKTMFYAIDENFGSMWPDKWPESELRMRHAEIGSIEFARAFKNQASDDSTAAVNPAWIKYADLSAVSSEGLVFFSSYDTAKGMQLHHDYTAGVIIAVDPEEEKVYVIDAWHARLTLDQRAERIKADWAKWSAYRILIESVGQAETDNYVLTKYPALRGVVVPVVPKGKKRDRMIAVTPLMERGDVIFSERLNPDSDRFEPHRGNLVEEILDLGIGAHDDMADAFSQALAAARRYLLDAWAPGVDEDDDAWDVEDMIVG